MATEIKIVCYKTVYQNGIRICNCHIFKTKYMNTCTHNLEKLRQKAKHRRDRKNANKGDKTQKVGEEMDSASKV